MIGLLTITDLAAAGPGSGRDLYTVIDSLHTDGRVRSYFHLHLVSDSTGETLIAVARAVAAQYEGVSAIEHVYPLVRSAAQLERVISEIEQAPGIVLYTLVEADLSGRLEEACRATGSPHLSVLAPVHTLIQSYLGAHQTARPGAQHMLNAD